MLFFLCAMGFQRPPKGPDAKIIEKCRNIFDTFCRFLTFFALREKCRKVSKIFLTLFGCTGTNRVRMV